jgi:hypothetical protein
MMTKSLVDLEKKHFASRLDVVESTIATTTRRRFMRLVAL